MKKILSATFALAALTGAAIAQGSTAPSQSGTASQPTGQPGLRQVDGTSIVMTFYTANPADTRASKLIGRTVYNLQNESIGEVNDLIIDNGKTIKAIIVGVGGFLGMGERNVAVAPASVVLSEMPDGGARLVVNTNKEDLKKAPAFNFADVDKAGTATGSTTGAAPATK